MFDYFNDILNEIGVISNIDYSKKIQSLGEIKKFWHLLKNDLQRYDSVTKKKTR